MAINIPPPGTLPPFKPFSPIQEKMLRIIDKLPDRWVDGEEILPSITELQRIVQEKLGSDPEFVKYQTEVYERLVSYWHGIGVEVLSKVVDKEGFFKWLEEDDGKLEKYVLGPVERAELVKQFNEERV